MAKVRPLKVLGRNWWQGIGALLALIALAVSIWLAQPRGAPVEDRGGSNTIVGDNNSCNAQGTGNEVSCTKDEK